MPQENKPTYEELEYALENIYMIAKRETRSTDVLQSVTAWQHVIRLCNAAGLKSSVLRKDDTT